MNFELKSLTLSQAAATPCDALVVVWPEQPAAGTDSGPLAERVRQEAAGAHWESGVAKLWASHGQAVAKAARLVLVRAGDGTPASVRKAVAAALGALKAPGVKKVVLSLAALPYKAGVVQAALTAAADPPLEPPGVRVKSQGLKVGPYPEFSVDEPIANSSIFVLPRITTPAAFNFATTVES